MIDTRVVVNKPLAIDSKQPVQRAVRAFTIQRNIQVVSNQRPAKRNRMRRQARISVKVRINRRNVEALAGLVFDLVIVDYCVRTCGNLCHGIGEIDGVVRTDERLYKRDLRTFAGDNQISWITRPRIRVSCRYEYKMNWMLDSQSTRDFKIGAIREECRVPCSERVIGQVCISPQMLFDDRRSLRISKSVTDGAQMKIQRGINFGQCRDESAIDEHQAWSWKCIQFRDQ